MPKPRSPSLESATARDKLAVSKRPIWVRLAPGIALGQQEAIAADEAEAVGTGYRLRQQHRSDGAGAAIGVDVDQIQHDCIDDRIPTAIGNAIRSLT